MNFSDSIELLQSALEQKLYTKLVAQLKKDFALSNISIPLDIDISPEQLINILTEKIYLLMMEHFSEYLNLMYIIDIPESAFKNIKVTDVVEVAEQASFLVVQRELQKVRCKEKYS